MKRRFILFALSVIGAVACVSCSNETVDENVNEQDQTSSLKYAPITLSDEEVKLTNSGVDFAFNLFRNIEKDSGDNVVLSPFSVTMALSMLTNGTSGETLNEILTALGYDGSEISTLNEYNKKLIEGLTLPTFNETVFSVANSLWVDDAYEPFSEYIADLQESYSAEVFKLSLYDAASQINEWCNAKTKGRISRVFGTEEKIVDPFLLLNATYFKGAWDIPFNESLTYKGVFYPESGKSQSVDFLYSKSYRKICSNDYFTLLEMAYADNSFFFYVILPNEGKSVESCLENLNSTTWNSNLNALKSTPVDFKLPKFSINNEMILNDALKSLGIEKAQNPAEADFSKLASGRYAMGTCKQICNISVDENGTEAAAVTAFNVGATGEGQEYVPFVANRPFLFVLSESSTGSILFLGKVAAPEN